MANNLDPEQLNVETFPLGEPQTSADEWRCTGCDSGCGIFPEQPAVSP
jgi:hypothetical protein